MKPFLEKLHLKFNLSFILFLVFLAVAIFLSIKLRIEQQSTPDSIEREKQMLNYRLNLINETFKANYELSGTKIPTDNNEYFYEVFQENSTAPVLYLKKYACSDCYVMTIEAILEQMSQWEAFFIISHSSNRHFVDEMKEIGVIPPDSRVVWTNEELPHGGGLYSTADLLILNPNMTIRFFLPLDFLKENYFFEEYMLFLENELTVKTLN